MDKYLLELFKNNTSEQAIIGLNNELKSLYLKIYLEQHKGQSIVVVTNSLFEANQLYQVISNYNSNVLLFPMDDFLTSEALAVSPELKTTRLETLIKLSDYKQNIVITNLMGFLRYLPLPQIFKNNNIELHVNDEVDINQLRNQLYNIGYEKETMVNKTGEVAIRGFVIDIFPVSASNPIRISFWGDTIESIREIDIDSQLSLRDIKKIVINPNTEFLVDNINHSVNKSELLSHRHLESLASITNISAYMEKPVIFFDNYSDIIFGYKQLVEEMFNYSISSNISGDTKYMNDLFRLVTSDAKYFMKFDEMLEGINSKKNYLTIEMEPFVGNEEAINKRLNRYIKENKQVIIALSSRYQIDKTLTRLNNPLIVLTNINSLFSNKINVVLYKMCSGFIIDNLIVISDHELFNDKKQNINYKTNFKLGTKVRDITKLDKGDYIVHSMYGIGRYCGIKTLTKNGLLKDYLMLQYKENDKLYLPVEKIEFISKYSANGTSVPKLSKLGGTEWAKTKLRVKSRIEDIAHELLNLYASREAIKGFSFIVDDEEQLNFEKEFPYQETTDQLRVTEEIKKDMISPKPMDRLLCGDVGFGKTEVAFRAIFKAIMSGKQVAFLCPTTILSNQHYQNALERFKNFGVEIALLNRFVTTKKIKQIKKDILSGKIDLVIGTHRLLSDDIKYKDLGLLVIDEEQRFGVKHKEKIKEYKNNIDVLTLSATPIPRTMQLSMAGIRNLSLIETAPVNRYPVQTYVMAKNKALIKDAIYKELSRDGQVFILYNHISDMELEANDIKKLVPFARVITAHGQMNKKELEDVMLKFINKEYDVLICTTIIETGIDIPNVNTLIINDADRFGLSQLYQIRGRVGRSERIAYCYLMYNPTKILSEIAIKRLNVIKDFTELGSGIAIAMRDLSIRGAGDILGNEQAGFIDTVGIELFLQMLNDEVAHQKGKEVAIKEDNNMVPLLEIATTIKDDYVEDEELKILIHRKINAIDSYDKLRDTKIELEDRFGKVSEDIIIYMYEEWFEKMANSLNIKDVKQTRNFINIMLTKELTELVDGDLLFTMASTITRNFRFSMRSKHLIITLDTVKLDKHFIYYLVEMMEVLQKAVSK